MEIKLTNEQFLQLLGKKEIQIETLTIQLTKAVEQIKILNKELENK